MIIQNINFFNGRIHIQIRMISIRIRKKSWEKKKIRFRIQIIY